MILAVAWDRAMIKRNNVRDLFSDEQKQLIRCPKQAYETKLKEANWKGPKIITEIRSYWTMKSNGGLWYLRKPTISNTFFFFFWL
jgi:hypothetical protein